MNCIFCDIVNHKSSAEILYENEKIISFLDINPMNYGHTLIIPKQHFENFLQVPNEYIQEMINGTKIISDAITKSIKPDGFNIVANNGRAAGQSVFHFHFHIIPRFLDDGFKIKLNLKKYQNGTIKLFGEKIRSEIK